MGDAVEIVASILPGFLLAALAAFGLGFVFNVGKPWTLRTRILLFGFGFVWVTLIWLVKNDLGAKIAGPWLGVLIAAATIRPKKK